MARTVCYKYWMVEEETEVKENSKEPTEIFQRGMTRGALVQGGRHLRKEAGGGILAAESAGGRKKKSLKVKRKANMVHGFKVSYHEDSDPMCCDRKPEKGGSTRVGSLGGCCALF